jgi:hypothetical protein
VYQYYLGWCFCKRPLSFTAARFIFCWLINVWWWLNLLVVVFVALILFKREAVHACN